MIRRGGDQHPHPYKCSLGAIGCSGIRKVKEVRCTGEWDHENGVYRKETWRYCQRCWAELERLRSLDNGTGVLSMMRRVNPLMTSGELVGAGGRAKWETRRSWSAF